MSHRWYYNLEGAQYGPADEAEIIRLIQPAELPPGVLVCQLGMMNWEPAREHACFQVEVYPQRPRAADLPMAEPVSARPTVSGPAHGVPATLRLGPRLLKHEKPTTPITKTIRLP